MFFVCIFVGVSMQQRRRERGNIPVKGVRLVEIAIVNGDGGDPFAPDVSVSNMNIAVYGTLLLSADRDFPFKLATANYPTI